MRRLRAEGWSYRKIAYHVRLSPERTEQLLKRDSMKARAYGPWVVFNDIPFLVMCRPNKEARIKAYLREYNRTYRSSKARLNDEMGATGGAWSSAT